MWSVHCPVNNIAWNAKNSFVIYNLIRLDSQHGLDEYGDLNSANIDNTNNEATKAAIHCTHSRWSTYQVKIDLALHYCKSSVFSDTASSLNAGQFAHSLKLTDDQSQNILYL